MTLTHPRSEADVNHLIALADDMADMRGSPDDEYRKARSILRAALVAIATPPVADALEHKQEELAKRPQAETCIEMANALERYADSLMISPAKNREFSDGQADGLMKAARALRKAIAAAPCGCIMTAKPVDDGGPAFPQPFAITPVGDIAENGADTAGMSLRDYFASKALSALVAGPAAQDICDRDPRYNEQNFAEVVAANAYEFADAMIRARDAS